MFRRSCKLWVGAGLVCALVVMIAPVAGAVPTDDDLDALEADATIGGDGLFEREADVNGDGITNSEHMEIVRDQVAANTPVKDRYENNRDILANDLAMGAFFGVPVDALARVGGAWLLADDPTYDMAIQAAYDALSVPWEPEVFQRAPEIFVLTTVTVPDVVGMSQSAAEAAITGAGLQVNATGAASETVPAGQVISQNPAGGDEAPEGSAVSIVVSTGAPGEPYRPVDAPVGGVVGFGALAGLLALGGAAVLLRRQKK